MRVLSFRVPAVLLFVIAALVMAACGGGTGSPSAAAPTQAGSAEPSAAAPSEATVDDCDGYPAQDITFVIPYGPGGGFDTWARLVAPVIQTKLPNGVNVIVENREGAGGLVGVTHVLGTEPDGYTIVITEPGVLATQQIAGTTEADFSSLRAIGRLTVGPEVIVVAGDSEWNTIQDVQAAASEADPLLMASGGIAAVNIVGFDALGLPYTDVPHDSSPEALLSIIRGDTDIAVYPLTSVREGIAAGDLKPLVVIGKPPAAGAPGAAEIEGVPSIDEVSGQAGLGDALAQSRLIAAPPGTPDCVVAILDQALADTFADADFQAQLTEAGFIPVHGSAEEAQGVIDVTFSTLEGYADLLRENLGG